MSRPPALVSDLDDFARQLLKEGKDASSAITDVAERLKVKTDILSTVAKWYAVKTRWTDDDTEGAAFNEYREKLARGRGKRSAGRRGESGGASNGATRAGAALPVSVIAAGIVERITAEPAPLDPDLGDEDGGEAA